MRVVVGVGGGIAAYKACGLVRLFREAGHDVNVLPTESALRFVGAPTWAALSGTEVSTSVWEGVADVPHVRLGQQAELVVVAPATANLMARAAAGLADDLLTATLLTATCPIVLAPAMHTEMWENAATQANVATLRGRGHIVVDPDSGRLTGADSGPGRLPEVESLYSLALAAAAGRGTDLAGLRVLISAGGTREEIDPVRYLGNRSSGRMGYALAAAAVARGARVEVVSANVTLPPPAGAELTRVGSAAQLADAVLGTAADVVIMAAAVADFRPAQRAAVKIKKGSAAEPSSIELVRNPDVLAELVAARSPGQTLVGFAAETGDEQHSVLELARTKLASKGCDILVLNDVSGGRTFGSRENTVTILGGDPQDDSTVGPTSKEAVANAVLDRVVAVRAD